MTCGIQVEAENWAACGEPAVAVYRFACVHEHVRDISVCARHESPDGLISCDRCHVAGCVDCPVYGVLVTDLRGSP